MSAHEIPLARRVAQVRAAISRCETAQLHVDCLSTSSAPPTAQLAAAIVESTNADLALGGMWHDVKAILEDWEEWQA